MLVNEYTIRLRALEIAIGLAPEGQPSAQILKDAVIIEAYLTGKKDANDDA